jgi:hypothetical protein
MVVAPFLLYGRTVGLVVRTGCRRALPPLARVKKKNELAEPELDELGPPAADSPFPGL